MEQSFGLALQQTLSPQMQQSLHILQAPTLELRSLVEQQLQENPVLEEEAPAADEAENGEQEDDVDQLSRIDEEWREYLSQSGSYEGRSPEAEERREYLLNSLRSGRSLQEHLLDQLGLANLGGEDREIAEAIIGNLNEAGLLDSTVAEIAAMVNTPVERVEKVLAEIQSMDPVGVAGRDLRDCLMIQLGRLGKKDGIEARVVEGHLDDLIRKRFREIARKLGADVRAIQAAADFISTLEPRPARQFNSDPEQVIIPDVVVEADGSGGFHVSLNNQTVPTLRISNYYKDLLADPGHRRQVRDYLREKIKGGRFFIKCIQQRQQTILSIATQIVQRQEDFMRFGPGALRPMTMSQVAATVGVHETTVSRATHGKYMATPHGVFEMKYFFTPGYQTAEGGDISNESVRRTIAEVVGKEDRHKPLSDQAILNILLDRGIPIARRTVAKYREQLGILPSHLRKTF